MWAYGYTNPFTESVPEDVVLGKAETFRYALAELADFVEIELVGAQQSDWWNFDHFAEVLRQIGLFVEKGNARGKDALQVDTYFTDEIGEIQYFVINI